MIALAVSGVYRPRINVQFLDDLRSIVGATALAAMVVTFVRVIVSDDVHTAAQAVRTWLFAASYLAAARARLPARSGAPAASRACGPSRR